MVRDNENRKVGLELLELAESGSDHSGSVKIGRDPREMTRDELRALGHEKLTAIQAIRARCIDCCAGATVEVRRCTAVYCPSWPFRMGFDPWRERRVLEPEQKRILGERLAKARSARAPGV
jgi:hypothetical protein